MNEEKLRGLKNKYMEIPIPDQLDAIVREAVRDGGKMAMKKKARRQWTGVAVASLLLFTAVLNISPAVANTLSEFPVVRNIVNVLTFREYQVDERTYHANIKTPAITGLQNKDLESILNTKYLQENKRLYQDFIGEMEEMKARGGGHLGVDSGFEVKTNNERILSIGRWVVNTVGSSSTTVKYDTVDKKEEVLITLPSLFKDDSYVAVISKNIEKQMREQMKADPGKIFWVSGSGEDLIEPFERIAADQNFYISNDGKLVICFDKYEAAPGYMGVPEFTIPTEVIRDLLVSDEYFK